MSLTKANIIERVYKEANFSKKEATDLVEMVFNIIKDTLAKGEKVKISGFGNFSIRDKGNRIGRNPQTGESMTISARRVLTYRPSQILKEDITAKYGHRLDANGNENESLPPKDGYPKALSSFLSGEEETSNDNDHDELDHLDED